MIARIWVWFNPPMAPVSAPVIEIKSVSREFIGWRICERIIIGAIFWRVDKIKHIDQDKEFITVGSQK